MAVIISDFLGPIDWFRPLRAIAARHEVLGIEVLDHETSNCRTSATSSSGHRGRGHRRVHHRRTTSGDDFARAAAAHREEVARTLRRCGAPLMTLRTDRDWIADIVRFVASRRRGAMAGVQ